jgi:hypothetical protein
MEVAKIVVEKLTATEAILERLREKKLPLGGAVTPRSVMNTPLQPWVVLGLCGPRGGRGRRRV